MNLRLKQTPGIYIAGYAGAGKSTVARHLAHRLGWSYFDTGDEIESAGKTDIAGIVSTRGEAEFRRIESEVLRQHVRWIEHGRPAVLALGEGTFASPANRRLLAENGVSVWLDCPLETVLRRVGASRHPLVRDAAAFAALYRERRECYVLADVHVPVESDDPEITIAAILRHPLFR